MGRPLRLLLIEDCQDDAILVVRELQQSGFDSTWERVETGPALQLALARQSWDLIISDHNLPEFSAPAALALVRRADVDVPFIMVSGSVGEEVAVNIVKQGASDYLLKDRLKRLGVAVAQALDQHQLRKAKRETDQRLRDNERYFRFLIENSCDGISLLDARGIVLYASPAVSRILGYDPEEWVGHDSFELVHPEDLATAQAQFAQLLGQRGCSVTALFRYRHKDGSWRWIEAVASNFLHEPVVQGVVCNFRNVTERQAAERQAHELRLAGQVQQRLLPHIMPVLPGYDIGGASFPAEATGGDYFDFILKDNDGLTLVIADVSGHGFSSALVMAETHAYLRALMLTYRHGGKRYLDQIGQTVHLLNRALAEELASAHFVTLLCAHLDPRTREFRYVNAGHPTGYVLDGAGAVKHVLKSTAMPLGVLADVEFPAGDVVGLETGDTILFLTDGILDARAPDDTIFGDQRALAIARVYRKDSARGIANNLFHAVRAFAQGVPQLDDVTSVVVKVTGPP